MKKNNIIPKVVTSCRSRFWIFEQAHELAKNQLLLKLIADYPKYTIRKYGIPEDKIESLLIDGLIYHGIGKINKLLTFKQRNSVNEYLHNKFSRKLPSLIPDETDFFIGLSSFCLEALKHSKERNIIGIVDHASLHMENESILIKEEAQRWGVKVPLDECADWIIEKENKEFQLANYIFVPSSCSKKSLIKNNVEEKKIIINNYGVNTSYFYPIKKIKNNIFRIIQAGKVSLRKGVLTLLDAYVKANIKNSELIILGGGIETSGIEKEIVSKKIKGVILKENIPFSELNDAYNDCDVMVLASVADGFALVVIQAMACGIPVIVTENVGASDLIIDGVNGFIVPVGRPDLIAEKLRLLNQNPDICINMGYQARNSVLNNNSWADYGIRLKDFLIKTHNKI